MISLLSRFFKTQWQPRQLIVHIPYTWLLIFFMIPFLLVFKISFSRPVLSIPPYQALMAWSHPEIATLSLNFGNYIKMVTDSLYITGLWTSLKMALSATALCLIVGYGLAYGIACSAPRWRHFLLFLIILPFWTSFLVRIYAWMGLLGREGLLSHLFLWMGWISTPQSFLYTNTAVMIGIVYCYLPFMVLPIYTVLEKIDPVYLEAAYDLGCRPWQAFWRITVPLSKRGVGSGCVFVLIPALGEFVIPELLGAPDNMMIGRIIWMEFFNNRDWPMASAIAVVMLALFIVPIMMSQRSQLDHGNEKA